MSSSHLSALREAALQTLELKWNTTTAAFGLVSRRITCNYIVFVDLLGGNSLRTFLRQSSYSLLFH